MDLEGLPFLLRAPGLPPVILKSTATKDLLRSSPNRNSQITNHKSSICPRRSPNHKSQITNHKSFFFLPRHHPRRRKILPAAARRRRRLQARRARRRRPPRFAHRRAGRGGARVPEQAPSLAPRAADRHRGNARSLGHPLDWRIRAPPGRRSREPPGRPRPRAPRRRARDRSAPARAENASSLPLRRDGPRLAARPLEPFLFLRDAALEGSPRATHSQTPPARAPQATPPSRPHHGRHVCAPPAPAPTPETVRTLPTRLGAPSPTATPGRRPVSGSPSRRIRTSRAAPSFPLRPRRPLARPPRDHDRAPGRPARRRPRRFPPSRQRPPPRTLHASRLRPAPSSDPDPPSPNRPGPPRCLGPSVPL